MKKLFLGLGAVAAVVTPVVAVVSCGDKSSSKEETTPVQQTASSTEHQQQAAAAGAHTGSTHANANEAEQLPSFDELMAMPGDKLSKLEFVIDGTAGRPITFDHWGIITGAGKTQGSLEFRTVFANAGKINDYKNQIRSDADLDDTKNHDYLLENGFDVSTVAQGDVVTSSSYIADKAADLHLKQIATLASKGRQYAVYLVPKALIKGIAFKA